MSNELDPLRVTALKAEIRAFIRREHPDQGGDPETFAMGLARLRAELAAAEAPAAAPQVFGAPAPRGLVGRFRARREIRRRPPRVR